MEVKQDRVFQALNTKMGNYDQVQEFLVRANKVYLIYDEDLSFLQDLHQGKNPVFPYWRCEKLNLDLMDQYEFKAEFRMRRNDVYTLFGTLNLPEELQCYNGAVVESAEALCILLRRVAYPCRYGNLVQRFTSPVPQLLLITNLVITNRFDGFGHLLQTMDQPWLSRPNAVLFAKVKFMQNELHWISVRAL